ncbi:DUF2399 domain-containing protein [Streptomyces atratus]|uniref:DUF2399 domain-containing protein n=1 Tax=Streptomyces atratus TaxID=1893 RepID=UPI003657D530
MHRGRSGSQPLAHVRNPGELTLPAALAPLVVHVVENPSILALALRRFGPDCPPLVCTSGWPSTAAIQLLCLLVDRDAALRYHGDFDGEDIRIAAYVLDKTRAHPWRMTAADYRAAVVRNAHGLLPGASPERRGTPRWPSRPWLSTAPPWSRNRWPMCCWKTSLPSPRGNGRWAVQPPSSA